MAKRTTVKETRSTHMEQTLYGPYEIRTIHRFRHYELAGQLQQDETIIQNGIIVFTACYPANTDYAKAQLERA